MKKHTRFLSLGLSVLFSVSCLIFPASAVEGPRYTTTLNGPMRQLCIVVLDKDGNPRSMSRSLPFDYDVAITLRSGERILVYDEHESYFSNIAYNAAISFTVNLTAPGKLAAGYITGENTEHLMTEITTASNPISGSYRTQDSGSMIFYFRNIAAYDITVTHIRID